jgi:hypothetical protein
VTRPRAADDFPMIRTRIEELRRELARPRAADDFATIRARMDPSLARLIGSGKDADIQAALDQPYRRDGRDA